MASTVHSFTQDSDAVMARHPPPTPTTRLRSSSCGTRPWLGPKSIPRRQNCAGDGAPRAHSRRYAWCGAARVLGPTSPIRRPGQGNTLDNQGV